LLPEAKLINNGYNTNNYLDYDGNEVITSDFTSNTLTFYDGVALATSVTASTLGFDDTQYFVSASGKKAITDYLKSKNDSFAISPHNGYFVVQTEDTEATTNKYTYKVYNYAGKVLLTVSGESITTQYSDSQGNVYLSVTSTETVDDTPTTVTTYYKLSK
jgi:hypothetical protein